ncbi:nucleolar protein 4 [Microdochium nivale]|nr:nucleolar protein 4 [Microdochium nivale]
MGSKRERAQPADTPTASTGDIETPSEPPSKKSRVEASRSIFVRSLAPTATPESLTEFFSQHFPVKHAHVITDPKTKESRGYGFVTFTDADDAKEAKEKLNKHKLDGRAMLLEIAEARHRKAGEGQTVAVAKKEQRQADLADARKAPKLIIRNLPWSIKKGDQLGALFQGFGKVKYADLPSDKGKLSGFGFITMRGHKNAEKAMEMLNGKVIDGRTIAVDWAVDKNQWQKQNAGDDNGDEEQKEKKQKKKDTKKSKAEKKEEVEEVEDEDEEVDEETTVKKPAKNPDDQLDEDLRNFMKNHMSNMEEEDDKDEDKDDEEDEDDDDGKDADETQQKKVSTDNSTTLFVRNLPFTTTDADLKTHFEQFGTIRYARIVMDRAADRPAGTGFVCFASPDEFKDCLRGAPRIQPSTTAGKKSILQDERKDPDGKYTIDGRVLQISQAVNKDEASRLADAGVAARGGKDRDKRRLYLLAEGQIPNDSALHRLLTPSEVQIRDQSAAQRKKLIQGNPSLHLSLTRLAVRNLPRETDSKELKALAREAVVGFATDVKEGRRSPLSREELTRCEEDKEADAKRREQGKGVVKQTKIIYENAQGSKVEEIDGASKSRGYGFIEFYTHRMALMGLRWLNGHALKNKAGKSQRLIVEFAIENANVVARRKDMQTKFSAGSGSGASAHNNRAGGYPKDSRDGKTGGFKKDGRDGKPGGFRKDGRDGQKGGAPRGKDFAVSNRKGKKLPGKVDGSKKPEGAEVKAAAAGGKKGKEEAKKEDFQQRIIGRKRMVRKKKAQSRG